MAGHIGETSYPHVREVLDASFAALSDEELEQAFESAFGEGVSPAEYEEFFGGLGKSLGQFAKRAAPIAATFGQGALQGAMGGSALGPWGAIGGALAGGVGSALGRHGRGPAGRIGGAISGVVGAAGQLTGRGGLAQGALGLFGGRGQAASQLMGLMRRPEMSQALASLLRGRNAPVPVGATGTPVPASAFAGLLGALAREAEAEAESLWSESESIPAYLLSPFGELVADPSDPQQRAARLHQLLGVESAPERWVEDAPEHDELDELEEMELLEILEIEESEPDAYEWAGV